MPISWFQNICGVRAYMHTQAFCEGNSRHAAGVPVAAMLYGYPFRYHVGYLSVIESSSVLLTAHTLYLEPHTAGRRSDHARTARMAERRAWVMVLGDVGRSPRMQYHTLSLCKTVSL
jgi:hypothetical protein